MTAALDRMDALFEKSKGGRCAIIPRESVDTKDALSVVYAARAVSDAPTLVKIARIAATVPHETDDTHTECRRCQIDKLMGELK